MTLNRILVLAAIYCAGVGAAAQISKLIPVLGAVQEWYDVTLPAATLLVSVIGAGGLVFGMVVGDLVVRAGLARSLAAAAFVALAAGLALTFAPTFPTLGAIRVLESTAHLVVVTAAPGLMSRIAPAEHRTTVLAIWASFFGVAFVASQALAATGFASAAPATFLRVHVILFVPFILALALAPLRGALRDERRDRSIGRGLPPLAAYVPIRLDAVVLAALSFACHSGTTTALLTLFPGEATLRYSLRPEAVALLSVSLPVVWLIATLGASAVLRRSSATTALVAGCVIVLIALAVLAAAPCLAGFSLPVAFVGFGLVQAAVFARIGELATDSGHVARLSGCYTQLGNAGILVTAPVVAALIPHLGTMALPLSAGAATLGILAFQLASRRAQVGGAGVAGA